MEVVDNPSNPNSKDYKNWKILVIVFLVLLIILGSVAAFLYVQMMQANNNSYAQPRYVQLLKSEQVSNATRLSNCLQLRTGNTDPMMEFYNVSNPTGLQEFEIIDCSSDVGFIVSVLVNGFNSSSRADFAYQNYQLGGGVYNFTSSGSITSSQHYSIFGTCNESNYCLVLTGIAISSLYVVRITASMGVIGQTPSVMKASMIRVMLGMQLSEIS